MALLNHPLLNGPRRVNGKKASTCEGPKLDDDVPRSFALWMREGEKSQALKVGLEPIMRVPEPSWSEFDSRKHGSLAPPTTKYIRLAATDTEPPF